MSVNFRRALAASLLCWVPPGLGHALTVRVDSSEGAPRIVVDGRPTPARMFFGSGGSAPIKVGSDWQALDFQFVATGDADNGTLHFRFGSSPGDIFLDDIQVTDLDQNAELVPRCDFEAGQNSFQKDWTFWPTGSANTVGSVTVEAGVGHDGSAGLHVALKSPPSGAWPDFHIYHHPNLKMVAGHHYRMRAWMKAPQARSLTLAFYRPGKTFTRLGGPPDVFESQIRLAAAVGVHFMTFPVGLPWPQAGEAPDWTSVDQVCEDILCADPQALMIPRIPMDPPDAWRQRHPDEVMQWEDGKRAKAVPASPIYLAEGAQHLAALITHLEERFREHMAGYHPDGQNTGEWFYEGTWNKPLNGYAPADLKAWRLWLRQHYATTQALRDAWRSADVTIESAAVPSAADRHAHPFGVFRDPVKERAILDWGEFQQDAMAHAVRTFAHAARAASHGKKLVLFFYGYLHELAAAMNGPATAGHYALRQVLDSPDIDILCSPISYSDRGIGGGAPSMTAAESVALAGKMWLCEDDTHTYLATGDPPGSRDHVTTQEATNSELVRNVAQEATRNFATWWMDLTATGWFNDPGMWAEMQKLRALDEPLLRHPRPYHPEIAVVVDEHAMLEVAAGAQALTVPALAEVRGQLGRVGAPYGQYLLDDVLAKKVHAKLYVFLNAWDLSAEARQKLLQATSGSALIWCYAPGYFEMDRVSPEGMRELTGFQLQAAGPVKAMAIPTMAGKALGLTQSWGVPASLNPLLAATDAHDEEILARYAGGGAAAAVRKTKDGVSYFVGAPGLSTELLRAAARQAGVHLYTEADCNVYANGPFVTIHASQDGPLTIHTGHRGPIKDLMSGEIVGQGPEQKLELHRGETRVFQCGEDR